MTIVVRLRNFHNQHYTGQLTVGNDLLRVSFNTGMYGIWIPQRIAGVDEVNMRRVYHSDTSETYNPAPGTPAEIRLQNGTVTLSGTRRTERLILGPTMGNGTVVGPQEVVVYGSVLPPEFYVHLRYDGFVGLGLPPPALGNNAVGSDPIWLTMMNRGLVQATRFSLYLRDVLYGGGTDGGALMFGGVSRRHYHGRHRYYELVANSHKWMIHMESVSVAGHLAQYCDKVLIDSGSRFIYGPPHIIQNINREILGREVPLYGTTVLTDVEAAGILHRPEVTFTLFGGVGNSSCKLIAKNYVALDGEQYSTVFRPLVLQPEDEPYFVLGLPWLRRYHTIFDFGRRRIGFSRAVQ